MSTRTRAAPKVNGKRHVAVDASNEDDGCANSVDLTRGMYRRIYGGFVNGRRINSVSMAAEAWFWRINSVADDFGNTVGDVALLYNVTVGRRGDVMRDDVGKWLEELEAAKLVKRYDADGDTYLHVVGFCALQPAGRNGKRVRRYPPFPGEGDEVNAGESKGPPGDSNGLDSPKGDSGCIRVNPGDLRAQHKHKHKHEHEQKNPLKPPKGGRGVAAIAGKIPAVRRESNNGHQPAGFAAFWTAWPRHQRKADQSKCEKHWTAHKLDDVANEIMAGLRRWKASEQWAKQSGQFVPAPIVWLRRNDWKAEQVIPAKGPEAAGDDPPLVTREITPEEEAMLEECKT